MAATTPLDENQTWVPLEIYNLYRTVIAAILNILFLLSNVPEFENRIPILPHEMPPLLSVTLYLYLAFSLLCHFLAKVRYPDYRSQALLQIGVDIMAIIILMQTSATSGLASLLVIVICASGILLPGQLSFLCAALASLSLLVNQFLISIPPPFLPPNYPQAGITGIVLFLTAIIINLMSQRLAASAQLAFERQLEVNKLQRLNSLIVEKVKVGALVVDSDDKITVINKTALGLLGKPREECLTHPLTEISPILSSELRHWQINPKTLAPLALQKRGEKIKLTPFILGRLDNGQNASLLVFLEDLSIGVREAQAIKLAAIGRLTATIAHEIRNPLMAIANATQLLLESKQFQGEERRLLTLVYENTNRTNSVIENILSVSRSRAPSPKIVTLALWIPEFLNQLTLPQVTNPKVTLDIPKDIRIFFDPEQLTQILLNLCENGFRYSFQETGQYTLQLKAGLLENSPEDRSYLDIIDDGKGVPPEIMEMIFDPFFTTEYNGNGLGLFIVKSLCEANQAEIAYHPTEKGQSAFRIIFSSYVPDNA